jgi:hypothetical protein
MHTGIVLLPIRLLLQNARIKQLRHKVNLIRVVEMTCLQMNTVSGQSKKMSKDTCNHYMLLSMLMYSECGCREVAARSACNVGNRNNLRTELEARQEEMYVEGCLPE